MVGRAHLSTLPRRAAGISKSRGMNGCIGMYWDHDAYINNAEFVDLLTSQYIMVALVLGYILEVI